MKRRLLPSICVGLLSASLGHGQTQLTTDEAAPATQLREHGQIHSETTPSRQEVDGTRFELQQQQQTTRSTPAQIRTLTTGTGEVRQVHTSPEAAAISENAQVISLRETPPGVRRHIERQAAFVPLQSIVKQMEGGKAQYEATFEGTSVETKLLLSETGKPLNLHVSSAGPVVYEAAGAQRASAPERKPGTLPQATIDRLRQQIGNVQIQSVQPRTVYDVTIQQNGQTQQIWVYEDGTILR